MRCFEITDEKQQETITVICTKKKKKEKEPMLQNEAAGHKQAEFHTSIEESSVYTRSDLSPSILSTHLQTVYS